MTVSTFFASDYTTARAAFLSRCADLDLDVRSDKHPAAKGPNGEDLFIDTARIGPKDARGILFITSATHGSEGLTGSGVQVALLNDTLISALPGGIALVLVHALNPYGFAHLCRTNEDNIDLNRNFNDFTKPHRDNPDYDIIHPWIVPDDWQGSGRVAAEAALTSFIETHGERHLQAILLQGQYTQPTGLFYGGTAPTWSNLAWSGIVKAEGAGAEHLAIIDLHTGIGPTGYGEPIYVGTENGLKRAHDWYGSDVTNPGVGKSHASDFNGPMVSALWTQHPGAEHTAILLEFGTRPLKQVLAALRADNWLRQHPGTNESERAAIKKDLRDALYVDEDGWRRQVWERSRSLIACAITGLNRAAPR